MPGSENSGRTFPRTTRGSNGAELWQADDPNIITSKKRKRTFEEVGARGEPDSSIHNPIDLTESPAASPPPASRAAAGSELGRGSRPRLTVDRQISRDITLARAAGVDWATETKDPQGRLESGRRSELFEAYRKDYFEKIARPGSSYYTRPHETEEAKARTDEKLRERARRELARANDRAVNRTRREPTSPVHNLTEGQGASLPTAARTAVISDLGSSSRTNPAINRQISRDITLARAAGVDWATEKKDPQGRLESGRRNELFDAYKKDYMEKITPGFSYHTRPHETEEAKARTDEKLRERARKDLALANERARKRQRRDMVR